jgi:hypothetical protein
MLFKKKLKELNMNILNLKNNCSLFYVESPFQLIQSVEAIHAFAIEKSKVIRENSSDNNNKQMREIVRVLKLNECTFIKCYQILIPVKNILRSGVALC